MADLTIIVAPDQGLGAIKEVLLDWSAAGLLAPFLWTTPSMFLDPHDAALEIAGGRAELARFNNLTGVKKYDRIRIGVLIPAFAVAALNNAERAQYAKDYRHLAVAVQERFNVGSDKLEKLRFVLTTTSDPNKISDIAVDSWHNIVVSPEDSRGPEFGQSLLTSLHTTGGNLTEVARWLTPTIVSALGLWQGLTSAPLDGTRPPHGQTARLARSYTRRLMSQRAEQQLRAQVLSMGESLPLPVQDGQSAVYVPDVSHATATMTDNLWKAAASKSGWAYDQSRKLLYTKPEPLPPVTESKRKTGPLEAIKMYFQFMASAIRDAPARFMEATVNEFQVQIAKKVQTAVFGADGNSAYEVVVNGKGANGNPANLSEVASAAALLDDAVSGTGEVPVRQYAPKDLSYLWGCYADAALTLADGKDRSKALPPVYVGQRIGVVQNPADIVPSRRDEFEKIPENLAVRISEQHISAYDVVQVNSINKRLDTEKNNPTASREAAVVEADFDAWQQQLANSFAVRVGYILKNSSDHAVAQAKEILRQIKQTAKGEQNRDEAAEKEQQRKARRKFLTLLILTVVLLAGGIVLLATGVLGVALGIGAIAIIAIFGISSTSAVLRKLLRDQDTLFKLSHAQTQQSVSEQKVAIANLRTALRDVRDFTAAYQQFLDWSRVLGVVIAQPFGNQGNLTTAANLSLAGLPESVQIGELAPDDKSVTMVAAVMKQDLFETGWLAQSYDAVVNGAADLLDPALLGAGWTAFSQNPSKQLLSSTSGRNQILTLWADALTENGVPASVGTQRWREALQQSEAKGRDFTPLFARVTSLTRPNDPPQTVAAYLGDIEQRGSGNIPDRMANNLLTPIGVSQGLSGVDVANDGNRLLPRSSSLKPGALKPEVTTLVQFSKEVTPEKFTFYTDTDDIAPAPRSFEQLQGWVS